MPEGNSAPISYLLIRLLFKFVLKVFYGTIVIENAELIPKKGIPCIVCANHTNSLTDALLLVNSVPPERRDFLRLTAKETQFGKRTFTSWLIESAGTVPLMRKKDYVEGVPVDNSVVMAHLMNVLEQGDAVCLFPEGMSRYQPTMSPLKTGVSRLVSDVLSRNRNNADFEITVLTCSVTYMHRQHFRSDVLITFHEPLKFTPKTHPELLTPVDYNDIRALTATMQKQIVAGTIDAPSWDVVRTAKLAARMYAPLGTRMGLGDYVRVVQTFVETFKVAANVRAGVVDSFSDTETATAEKTEKEAGEIVSLGEELKAYQDWLSKWGIKDDRVRRPLRRPTIIYRMLLRLAWCSCLFTISLPGLLLWLPVFATTTYGVRNLKKTGPIWDTYDEIAQYKLIYGLMSGLCVWIVCTLVTLPFAPLTAVVVPAVMWMTLRWLEDAISAFRAFTSLRRLLWIGKSTLTQMRSKREDLYKRVMHLAVDIMGLPADPERYFVETGGREKGRVRGRWQRTTSYFSIRRRRKQDWNETLRLYDKVDYPEY